MNFLHCLREFSGSKVYIVYPNVALPAELVILVFEVPVATSMVECSIDIFCD